MGKGNDFLLAQALRWQNSKLSSNLLPMIVDSFHLNDHTCRSKNTHSLSILDAPAIVRLSETIIVTVGELAILTCQVSGNPDPSVTWTKDGHASIPRAHFQNNGRLLAIQEVIPGDEGVYQCKASNVFGESQTATSLVVGGKYCKFQVTEEDLV